MDNNNPRKQTVDIKSILYEIRDEIREKGYINDLPVFDGSPDQQFLTNIMNDFSGITNKEFNYLKTLWEVEPNKQLNGSKLVIFLKKIIRKFIKFYIVPIVGSQNAFNHSVVHIIEEQNAFNHSIVHILLRDYVMKMHIDILYDRVTKLEELLHKKENT